MAVEHAYERTDFVDTEALRADLESRLERPIDLLVRPAQEGAEGVLIAVDPATQERLDVDGRTVRAALKVFEPVDRRAAMRERAAKATTVPEMRELLLELLADPA